MDRRRLRWPRMCAARLAAASASLAAAAVAAAATAAFTAAVAAAASARAGARGCLPLRARSLPGASPLATAAASYCNMSSALCTCKPEYTGSDCAIAVTATAIAAPLSCPRSCSVEGAIRTLEGASARRHTLAKHASCCEVHGGAGASARRYWWRWWSRRQHVSRSRNRHSLTRRRNHRGRPRRRRRPRLPAARRRRRFPNRRARRRRRRRHLQSPTKISYQCQVHALTPAAPGTAGVCAATARATARLDGVARHVSCLSLPPSSSQGASARQPPKCENQHHDDHSSRSHASARTF